MQQYKRFSTLVWLPRLDALGTVFLFFFSTTAAALHPKAVSLLTATLLLCRCCFLHVASCVAHSRERNKHLTAVSPIVAEVSLPPRALMGFIYDWLCDVCQNITKSWRGAVAACEWVWPFLVLCMEKGDQPRSLRPRGILSIEQMFELSLSDPHSDVSDNPTPQRQL